MSSNAEQIDLFLDQLWLSDGLSRNTLSAYRRDLLKLGARLDEEGGVHLVEAGVADLQRALLLGVEQEKATTRARLVSAMRRFYQYLHASGQRPDDPSAALERPKHGQPLPKSLSEKHVVALLEAPDVATPLGLRDRAMLEVLYATGLRVSELVGLTLQQVDLTSGVVMTLGKGGKERLVPMGEVAQDWLGRYLATGRPALLDGGALRTGVRHSSQGGYDAPDGVAPDFRVRTPAGAAAGQSAHATPRFCHSSGQPWRRLARGAAAVGAF